MLRKTLALFAALSVGFPVFSNGQTLKTKAHFATKVPEPSDIAVDSATGNTYLVSDNGLLYKCDARGKILQKAAFEGMDFEGVAVTKDYVYVADESLRKIHRFQKATLSLDKTWSVPYFGARNRGYESLAWNPAKQCFIVITEKSPIIIRELDSNFDPIGEVVFSSASDISAARWHNGFLYLLSDEDHSVLQCDPKTYEVLKTWKLDVLNPEGIDFSPEGDLIILSDDLHTLYYYNHL
ncbi:MAG: SdiA-regulated domain-containing protein [Edaphocola sp.]